MFRQLTFLIVLVIAVGLTPAQADLIHHWKLDENTEAGDTVAVDSVGGLNGDIQGAQSVPGKFGNAISFDGTDDIITINNFIPPQQGSVAFWLDPGFGSSKQRLFGAGGDFEVILYSTGIVRNELFAGGSGTLQSNPGSVEPGQWFHIVVTYAYDGAGPSTVLEVYVNGELDVVGTAGEPTVPTDTTLLLGHRAGAAGGEHYGGLLDDLRIYDHVLSQAEIKALANPPRTNARDPNPADGTFQEDTWVNLSWTAGDFAVSHNIYIGEDIDAVNEGTEGSFAGNLTDTFIVVGFPGFPYPDGLVPGTTYYWRIDEVNDAEPNSPWKGDVWSFSIPPKTAYLPVPTDGAESVDTDIQLTWTPGFGSKLHTVYFGDNFEDVNNATGGQTQGSAAYTPGTLKMAKTYYWRVDEFDILETHKGNVWSFITDGAVEALDPVNGAVDVSQNPVLTWTPGLGASHEIYFGTDPASLELKGSGSLGQETYEPGELEWNTTYYWRIDEANSTNSDSPWTGPLWSFTTANFLVIDDMESYNDLDPADPASNRIFNAWLDGYDNPSINGSIVGHANAPFVEQSIVHGGGQSMPFDYNNSVGKSEATLTLTSNHDWTIKAVNRLTIWYRGSSSNAPEIMYVKLNSGAAVDNDNPSAAQASGWIQWNIPLQEFADQGLDLTNITSITIGLRSVTGGTGMLYFDDIRLYAP